MYTDKEFSKRLGEALKAERLAKGESTYTMGEKMGVDNTTIYYYETGRNNMSAAALKRYCEILGIDLAEFVKKYFD